MRERHQSRRGLIKGALASLGGLGLAGCDGGATNPIVQKLFGLEEQTILAYDFNDAPLQIPHGAPLRLRVERQLGYKMSKYVMRIELVDSFAHLGDGHGRYWEDNGYTWYAGV